MLYATTEQHRICHFGVICWFTLFTLTENVPSPCTASRAFLEINHEESHAGLGTTFHQLLLFPITNEPLPLLIIPTYWGCVANTALGLVVKKRAVLYLFCTKIFLDGFCIAKHKNPHLWFYKCVSSYPRGHPPWSPKEARDHRRILNFSVMIPKSMCTGWKK